MLGQRNNSCFLVCLTVFVGGCAANWPRATHERTVELAAPAKAGGDLVAETHNGSIAVSGQEVAECKVRATIRATAATEQVAKELAEKVEVKLEQSGQKLAVKVVKPVMSTNQSVCVDYDIKVPKQTNLELATHNGAVDCQNVLGAMKIKSHNGSIICKQVSGDIEVETHNGRGCIVYSEAAPATCNVRMMSHNGDIEIDLPKDFSASVDASTHNGVIQSDVPIIVQGSMARDRLKGAIGKGEGKLHLETYTGAIHIK